MQEETEVPPIEVTLTAPQPQLNEVEIGGEDFKVRISSAAALGEVVEHAKALFANRPATKPSSAGFALPGSELRGSDEALGSSMWAAPRTINQGD